MPSEVWKVVRKDRGRETFMLPKGAEFLTLDQQHGDKNFCWHVFKEEK